MSLAAPLAASEEAPADHPLADLLAPLGAEPWLLTPGPLSTTRRTKDAMLRDWGSWDGDFRRVTAEVRRRLIAMANGTGVLDCVPMQGSGSFAVESALGTFVPKAGKVLVLMNGAYGQRAARTLGYMGRAVTTLDKGDYLPPDPAEVADILDRDPAITDVVLIHCETSSGILNPLAALADVVKDRGRRLIVDAMSSFGAVPLTVDAIPFDVLVSSANKCIEGVPGFGFILARTDLLEASAGQAHSLSLDAHDQWQHMNRTGQWRFTPPTHVVVAFLEALLQHAEEGGVPGRLARYTANRDAAVGGLRGLGFETLLADRWLSPIITTFFSPADPAFAFQAFYDAMKRRGFIIYPGKLTVVDSFRIGHIGRFDAAVVAEMVAAVREAVAEMGVTSCAPPAEALAERARLS